MGEIAALLTACCWAFSSIFFTAVTKRIGPLNANRSRLVVAVVILAVVHTIFYGKPLPLDAEPQRWLWLCLSGIVGLVLGDTALFQCYMMIGNRLGTLLMASVPVVTSVLAWVLMGEMLNAMEIGGILICMTGIFLVLLDRKGGSSVPHTRKQYTIGILLGILSAICQATGLTLAKKGLGGDFPALSGVIIRMLSATAALWLMTFLSGQGRETIKSILGDTAAQKLVVGGTLIGPVIGVWLSMIAVQSAYVGVASTLMALTPVIMLPIARWGYKEMVSMRAVAGTVVALAGVVVIFLVP